MVNDGDCLATGYANYSDMQHRCGNCSEDKVFPPQSNCIRSVGMKDNNEYSYGKENSNLISINTNKDVSSYYTDQFQSAMKIASYNVSMAYCMAIDETFWYVGASNPYYYSCNTTDIIVHHCMAVVGSNIISMDGQDGYLLIRNSWGTEWGDNGYYWLSSSAADSCQVGYFTWNSWKDIPWSAK